jgi:hypothetical protein
MPPRPSLLGRGLPERLRSTSLALVGLVGAAGLVMVALTLQPGAPLVSSGPIPEAPHRSQTSRHLAVGVAEPATQDEATRLAGAEGSVIAGPEPQRDHASTPIGAPVDDPVPAGEPVPSDDPVLVTDSEPRGDRGAQRRQPAREDSTAPSAAPAAPAQPPAAPAPQVPDATASTEPPAPPAPAPPSPDEASGQPGNGNGNAYGRGNGKGHGATGTPPGHAVD